MPFVQKGHVKTKKQNCQERPPERSTEVGYRNLFPTIPGGFIYLLLGFIYNSIKFSRFPIKLQSVGKNNWLSQKKKYTDQNDRIGHIYRFQRSLDHFVLKNE